MYPLEKTQSFCFYQIRERGRRISITNHESTRFQIDNILAMHLYCLGDLCSFHGCHAGSSGILRNAIGTRIALLGGVFRNHFRTRVAFSFNCESVFLRSLRKLALVGWIIAFGVLVIGLLLPARM